MNPLPIGLIGADTSHVEVYAELLHDPAHPLHVPGGRIVAAFPGGSPDFPLSASRLEGFTRLLREKHGVTIVDSPYQAANSASAVLLTSVDGRAHLRQFAEIAPLRRPVFIDKPFAVTLTDAAEMVRLARLHKTPLFSSSNLRFSTALRAALDDNSTGRIIGADFSGPLSFQPTQPGLFWYGIHAVEMLYASLGCGCRSVRVFSAGDQSLTVGYWKDGRIGTCRGNPSDNHRFCGVLHREQTSQPLDCSDSLLRQSTLLAAILRFFRGGATPVALDETLEIIRFLEAANVSMDSAGQEVLL